jgi:hypothetical protein
MLRELARMSKGATRTAAAALPLLAILAASCPTSFAGRFHVYSCRTPAGEGAPVDGWSGSLASGNVGDDHVSNTCGSHGALIAALGDQEPHYAGADQATWTFTAPTWTRVTGATLWRAGYLHGGGGGATYQFWFASPGATDVFDQCLYANSCVGLGTPSEPQSAMNRVVLPPKNLGPNIYMNVSCGPSLPNAECPHGFSDPNGYAAVVYLYAADLTLEQAGTPMAGNVGGEVASAPRLTGKSDLTFDAADPGAGVYEAVFSVDGQVVQRTVLDENGGRCSNVGQTTDGTLAFLYLQPCPTSLGVDIAFDSSGVSNGVHHLVVSVVDAAGNSAPVLDRTVTVFNPAAPGPPNGANASASATLNAHWLGRRGSTLTTRYGRGARIVGRLTAPGGGPISGAVIEVRGPAASPGCRRASANVRTGGDGRFAVRLPGRLSSCRVQVSYRARLGDSSPAASRTLLLRVRAGIALSITPRTSSAGGSIFFNGRLRGGPIPTEGKQLVLEARSPGGQWIEFKVVRTDPRGRFAASYTFRFAGPALYEFRAVSEPESDYPYAAGSSRVVLVRER